MNVFCRFLCGKLLSFTVAPNFGDATDNRLCHENGMSSGQYTVYVQ